MMTRNQARRAAIARGPLKTTLSRASRRLRITVTITAYSTFVTNGHRHTADPADPSARRWRVHVHRDDHATFCALYGRFNPCRLRWSPDHDSFFVRQGRDVADLEDLHRILREVSA